MVYLLHITGVTRVPAAVEAFVANRSSELKSGLGWCQGSLQALLADGSVLTSFKLYRSSAQPSVEISGFQAKVHNFDHLSSFDAKTLACLLPWLDAKTVPHWCHVCTGFELFWCCLKCSNA